MVGSRITRIQYLSVWAVSAAGGFLEKLKFTAWPPRRVVIVAARGREVGVSGCELRSPFDTEIIAHVCRAAEHTLRASCSQNGGRQAAAELASPLSAWEPPPRRRRRRGVVFHYAQRHIYCQVVAWCGAASSMPRSRLLSPDCSQFAEITQITEA